MNNKIVVSVVAGFLLLGTTLAAAQCPPNLKVEDIISCVVSEGAGIDYEPAANAVEVQAAPASVLKDDPLAVDNGALTTAQINH
jgi:hypothetical protein